jgi:hypothetical protein
MALTQREIREHALAFAHEWANATRERAESQTFWNEFFNIFGITRRRVASFEEPVLRPGRAPGSIDLLWKGKLLVEHKSRMGNGQKTFHKIRELGEIARDILGRIGGASWDCDHD